LAIRQLYLLASGIAFALESLGLGLVKADELLGAVGLLDAAWVPGAVGLPKAEGIK
jgi:hypothetical protein